MSWVAPFYATRVPSLQKLFSQGRVRRKIVLTQNLKSDETYRWDFKLSEIKHFMVSLNHMMSLNSAIMVISAELLIFIFGSVLLSNLGKKSIWCNAFIMPLKKYLMSRCFVRGVSHHQACPLFGSIRQNIV